MKRILFTACIVLACSTLAWGAIGLPASTDKAATADEPIIKIIKIGDETGAAPKCGKTCGKRPFDLRQLGDVLAVKTDGCGGCDKKCEKGNAAGCPAKGAGCDKQCGKDKAGRCTAKGAGCDKKCGGKCAGKCADKAAGCDKKCGGQCAGKCAGKCSKPCDGKGNKKCDGQCGKKCGGKCGQKPGQTIEREEIVIRLSDIPGHEGLALGEDAEVRVIVLGDDEGPSKLFGDHHGKKKSDKKACRTQKCSKDKRGSASYCGDKGRSCEPKARGDKAGCGCNCDCCGPKARGGKARAGCCPGDDDVCGMIVIMCHKDGTCTVKTVGECAGRGCCPVMGQGCKGGERQGSCHQGKGTRGCSGKCHGKSGGDGCHATKRGDSCQGKCDGHREVRDHEQRGHKAIQRAHRRATRCGGL